MIDGSAAGLAVNSIVWAVALASLFVLYSRVRAESVLHGYIFAAGAAGRLVFGAVAFLISYYEAPVLEGLHTGEGFWILALDAELYFDMAAEAARSGLAIVRDTDPSPMYVRAMALWMDIAGVTPASAVLFNVLCYAGIVLLLSKVFRSGRAGTLALLAFTMSPALLFVSTQALKDAFCVLLIVAATAGVSLWTSGLARAGSGRFLALIGAGLLICLSTYLFAGIRAYFAVFMLASMAAASVWTVLARTGGLPRGRIVAAHAVLIAAALLSAMAGGGPYFEHYTGMSLATVWEPGRPLDALDKAREGFIASGGATNFGDDFAASAEETATLAERTRSLLTGMAAIFVPISVLNGLSIIDFEGGRGLLFITDLDTIVLDLALIAAVYLLAVGRRVVPVRPVTVFVVVLGGLTVVTMAYVVTNFGTLFRLRLLAVAPLWLLPAVSMTGRPRHLLSSKDPPVFDHLNS